MKAALITTRLSVREAKMKITIAISLFILFIAPSSSAEAASVGCPWSVEYVLVEAGHEKPYPVLVSPDVEEPRQEWNYLSNGPQDIPVTVHCFSKKDQNLRIDVLLPNEVRKCTLAGDRFWCE